MGIAVSRIPKLPPAFADQQALFGNAPVRCVVDRGASIGIVAQEYRKLFPQAEVFAFEAFEEHFRQLETNTRHDPLIRPLHLGVSDVIGPVALNVNCLPDTNSILTAVRQQIRLNTRRPVRKRFNPRPSTTLPLLTISGPSTS